ncbi:MAG: hypothetical protein WAV41_05160 [Microgenomates group bacterium]
MKFSLRLLYLYLFSFVGLLIVVIGGIQIVNLGLKTFIFKNADRYPIYAQPVVKGDPNFVSPEEQMKQQEEQTRNQRQSEFANSLAMMTVGLPLYLYHWKTIQKESK